MESDEMQGYQLIVLESIAKLTCTSNPYVGATHLKHYMEVTFAISQLQWEDSIVPVIKQLLDNNIIVQFNKSYGFLCKQTTPKQQGTRQTLEHQKEEHKLPKKSENPQPKSVKQEKETTHEKPKSEKPKPEKPAKISKPKEHPPEQKKILGPDVEITKSGRISYKRMDSSSD